MATRGINKVMLIGHLGQEPEVRQMAQGGAVTTISLATSESWRDRQTGQQQERTEWHRVVFKGLTGLCGRQAADPQVARSEWPGPLHHRSAGRQL